MVLWNKPAAKIPAGWAEVEDWRGRMPVGWNPNDGDFDTVGEIGGQKTKQLSIAEMPSHNHTISNQSNSHEGWGKVAVGSDGPEGTNPTTDYKGGNQPFSIMNPYRVVLFIEYVG